MKSSTTYRRFDPDTVLGEKLEIKLVYSSFDKAEIDQLEENCKIAIGSGVLSETVKVRDIMRDYTGLSDNALEEELKGYALFTTGKGSDLCFAASLRLKSYADRIRELEEEIRGAEDDGK